jgi:chromate transporter
MNVVLLYLVLMKGTVTAFAGLASLPVIQESLVNHYHVLTNEQLNEAVVITRSSPGPSGFGLSVRAISRPGCREPSPVGLR